MAHDEPQTPATAGQDYADRLVRLSGRWWKRLLPVQLPYRLHLRSLRLGRTLDVGCGTGRNLHNLGADSVGVDHNAFSVAEARAAGLSAVTDTEFFADEKLSALGSFDSMLVAHVIEHLEADDARSVLSLYLPMIRPGGKVVFITPQERGYASDATHVAFTDTDALRTLATDLGLHVEKTYSFPFPRALGTSFTYNEFVLVGRRP